MAQGPVLTEQIHSLTRRYQERSHPQHRVSRLEKMNIRGSSYLVIPKRAKEPLSTGQHTRKQLRPVSSVRNPRGSLLGPSRARSGVLAHDFYAGTREKRRQR